MLEEIAKYFGGQSALATTLGVDRSAVTQWRTEGIPYKRALQIEVLSDGLFKAVDIVKSRL